MKLKKTIEVDIGVSEFAASLINSEDQAVFFNRLAHEFELFSNGDRDGMQMLYIKEDLTAKAKEFIKKLSEYVSG